MDKPRILLAEDDPNLSFVIEDHLLQAGYEVICASNGVEGLAEFERHPMDICVLDVMMPKMDGFSLATEIRKRNENVPILFLTARSMEEDRLKGFEIGGDDYISKPFSMAELTHRIQVFIRRSIQKDESTVKQIALGSLKLDKQNLLISGQSGTTQMTQMEADLLFMLFRHKNQLVKREDILITIWGENDYFKGRSLDVFISRLRKYLKEDPSLHIKNHHGVGFTLIDDNFSG
ncbi:MAG: response regulator transcription factor [Cyclobacteriaceae bacterium]